MYKSHNYPLSCYAATPLRPPSAPLPLYAPAPLRPSAPPDSPPTTKHLKYLSNHRVFSNPNPTQESSLLALSNEPSFIQFHAAVLKIAFTHNISPTAQDIATTKDSLEARSKALQYEPNLTEIHAAVVEKFTKE